MIEIDRRAIEKVIHSDYDDLRKLSEIAGLDPHTDFVSSTLAGLDFRQTDLSSFDLEYADLRRTTWGKPNTWPYAHAYAMLGTGNDRVVSSDFVDLAKTAKVARTWSERFFAFSIILENFGETKLTLDLLIDILKSDRSTYMTDCSLLHYAASFSNYEEAKDYCRSLASLGNSYANMYKIGKVRRLAGEVRRYLEAIESKPQEYPGQVSRDDILNLFKLKKWKDF